MPERSGRALAGMQYGECWNLIKRLLTHSISRGFYSWTGRGRASIVVSKPGGLEFELWPRIIPLRIITAYRSPYGGARVAQTSGSGWHTVGGMLEPDK
jgi:hypothetical protein